MRVGYILELMEIAIKSMLVSKGSISKMSLNTVRQIVAMIVDGYDTIVFYRLEPEVKELFVTESRPAGKKSVLSWSLDGKMLAVGSVCLEIWILGSSLAPLYTFNEDFIDIRLLAWSSDSTHIAYAGSSRSHSVKLRTLSESELPARQIVLEAEIAGLNYDPFGKYLLVLMRTNILVFYSSSNCSKVKSIKLTPNASPDLTTLTVKELRFFDWSPDFQSLVLPSLQDNKMPLAISLSRLNEFQSEMVFIGHSFPISCVRFNPKIFKKKNTTVSILAMGDTCGTVSIWEMGQPTPMFLINTPHKSLQIIEDLEWTADGCTLISNVLKKYIYLYQFHPNTFGDKLQPSQISQKIENTFGAKNVRDISSTQLEVFKINVQKRTMSNRIKNNLIQSQEIQGKSHKVIVIDDKVTNVQNILNFLSKDFDLKQNEQNIYEIQKIQSRVNNKQKIIFPISHNGINGNAALVKSQQLSQLQNEKQFIREDFNKNNKDNYLQIQQQKITFDKNNRKKIQPALKVRKTQIFGESQSYLNQISNLLLKLHKPLQLAQINNQLKKCYSLGLNFVQVFQNSQRVTFQITNKDKERLLKRVFNSAVQSIQTTLNRIYVVTENKLYIFDKELTLCALPVATGILHRFTVNEEGDMYFLNTNGQIKGLNIEKQFCITTMPVFLQEINSILHQSIEIQDMRIGSNKFLELVFKIEEFVYQYFYDFRIRQWVSLELNEGIIKKQYSVRISQNDLDIQKNFFMKLIQNQLNTKSFEANLIYYSKYNVNKNAFNENLLAFFKQLKSKKRDQQLRIYLHKYFVDKQSKVYQTDVELRNKVKQIGGPIIQEFDLFQVL